MTELYLGGNELTEIPSEIGNLVNLQSLYLYGNQFTNIPSEIRNLTNLITLDIGYNQLTGEIPSSICNLGKIYKVELPICNSVKKIIDGVNSEKIISNLLSRPLQFEN